jgi:hypothetical protein
LENIASDMTFTFDDLTVPAPPVGSADWNADGVVVIEKFFPEELLQQYEECWVRENSERPGGWPDPIPYMRHDELKNLLCWNPLAELLQTLINEPAGLHLNLTGWVSTQRNWHQDSYLNPPHVGDFYAAIWIALDDIDPDSGPFQYVPGSHRWPQVTRENILAALNEEERGHGWPKFSERILTPLFVEEIEKRGVPVVTHLPKRGDVFVWHGRLMHRGSVANKPGMMRKALIAHYSGINHRTDMPKAQKWNGGGFYFPLQTNLSLYYGKK